METHEPEGATLIIHSVVIHPKYRRQGFAFVMLSFYLERMMENPNITRIFLIAKGNLLGFYTSVGFKVVRLSPVVHGQDPWFEMALDLTEHRQVRQYHVDAFSTKAFEGNAAGVVFQHYSDHTMQRLAAENNFGATAFVQQKIVDSSVNKSCVPQFHIR